MNELINVKVNESQEQIVSGRELHEFLGVETPYHIWFPRMKDYGFIENVDFSSFEQKSTNGRPSTDHVLKIDMAKEISMLQRNEKGKMARQYFIELEKQWNSPESVMARAIKIADRKILDYQAKVTQLEHKAKEDKPKVLFADAVSASKNSILVGELAKLLKQNSVEMGQNRLFEWLRSNGYLISRKGSDYNAPTQRAMELKLFKVKETTITHSDGHISVNKTTKVTGKGQQYFINKFLKNKELTV